MYLLTMDVAIDGMPESGLVDGQPAELTFTVTDADRRADGSATPIAGATVTATSDAGTVGGLTDANGQVVLRFTPLGGTLRVVVDKDANGAAGGPTLGSTSPDPVTHGQVAKQDFNDRVITLPEPGCWLGLAFGRGAARRITPGKHAREHRAAKYAARQRAEAEPAAAAEARRAERVGDRGRRGAQQQRRLERERDALDEPARARARRRRSRELSLERGAARRRARVGAARAARARASSAGTQSGSRAIARSTSRQITLPEPSQIALTGASR